MNAIHLTPVTLIAAALATVAMIGLPRAAAAPQAEVVTLPAVQVVGKRPEIVTLPTVHVVARRVAPAPTVVAQKAARANAL